MSYSEEQINEMVKFFRTEVFFRPDRSIPFIFIKDLPLPKGCVPEKTDAVFIPQYYQGYSSRLYLREKVTYPNQQQGKPNWQEPQIIYGERWFVFSFNNVEPGLLSRMVLDHLRGLTNE
jgi:hypothetical protein